MSTLNGDGPCVDCGGPNIVWFTDNVLWNEVCRRNPDQPDVILCIPCFVARAEVGGLRPTGWRLLAEFPWRGARP